MAKHSVDFSEAIDFDWSTALETKDTRFDYDEVRWVALGYIGKRVHVLIYTVREERIRLISLRRANRREKEFYEKNKT